MLASDCNLNCTKSLQLEELFSKLANASKSVPPQHDTLWEVPNIYNCPLIIGSIKKILEGKGYLRNQDIHTWTPEKGWITYLWIQIPQ